MRQSSTQKKDLYIEIGKRIAECRRRHSLTQEDLANEIEVSTQYISNLERGLVGASVETIIKICNVLESSSDYILLGSGSSIGKRTANIDLNRLSKKQLDYISESLNIILTSGNNV